MNHGHFQRYANVNGGDPDTVDGQRTRQSNTGLFCVGAREADEVNDKFDENSPRQKLTIDRAYWM